MRRLLDSVAHRSTDRESLFSAVEKDDEQSVAKLLKRVDVDARDENDYTALLLAAETGARRREVRRAPRCSNAIHFYSVVPILHEALVEPHVPGAMPALLVVAFVNQSRERRLDEAALKFGPRVE